MRSVATFILIGILSSTPGLAQPDAAGTPPAEQSPKGEKLKCKRLDDGNTGTNLKRFKKICKTEAEWKAEAQDLERRLDAQKN
jgi:hypothetical protein